MTVLLGHAWLAFGLSCLVAFGVGYASYQTQGYREAADRARGRPGDRGAEAAADDAARGLQAQGADHGPHARATPG